jgi:uncharacterized protein
VIALRSAKSLAVQIAMIWAAVLLILAPAGLARAEIQFPALTGRVVDDAHVLSAEQAADLSAKLKALEEKNGRQMVVVTLPSLQGQEISDFGYQLGRKWAIGQKGENNGVLFIIAPAEHKVRIEVGYGLEPVLTDALSSVILQQAVLPKFRSGDMAGGIVDGTSALVEHLGLDDATAKAKVAEAAQKQVVRHSRSSGNPLGGFIALIVIYFVISSLFRRGGGGGLGGWFWPLLFLSSLGRGGRSDWGGGDGGGWGGGGGNDSFGGGGGSFGGGGSSGDW